MNNFASAAFVAGHRSELAREIVRAYEPAGMALAVQIAKGKSGGETLAGIARIVDAASRRYGPAALANLRAFGLEDYKAMAGGVP